MVDRVGPRNTSFYTRIHYFPIKLVFSVAKRKGTKKWLVNQRARFALGATHVRRYLSTLDERENAAGSYRDFAVLSSVSKVSYRSRAFVVRLETGSSDSSKVH